MELIKIITIIRNNYKVFLLIWLGCIVMAGCFILLENKKQKIILPVSIARDIAPSRSDDYQYDQYYRMLANEKFGQFLVGHIKGEVFFNQLNRELEKRDLSGVVSVKSQDLAPGFISVEIVIPKKNNENTETAVGLFKDLLREKSLLSQAGENEEGWFSLKFDKFIVTTANVNLMLVLSAGIIFGFFVSLSIVLFVYYWKQ